MNYLIMSRKHTNGIAIWWRPGAAGYTNNLDTAGRYSKEDAESYCLPSHGDDFAVEELQAYKLATRVIVDMGDGANNALLMSPNASLEGRAAGFSAERPSRSDCSTASGD